MKKLVAILLSGCLLAIPKAVFADTLSITAITQTIETTVEFVDTRPPEVKLAELQAINALCESIPADAMYQIFDINAYSITTESITGLVTTKDIKFTIKSIGEEYAYSIDQDGALYAIPINLLPVGTIEKSTLTIIDENPFIYGNKKLAFTEFSIRNTATAEEVNTAE